MQKWFKACGMPRYYVETRFSRRFKNTSTDLVKKKRPFKYFATKDILKE